MNIKKNMTVKVISGNSKVKQGKVLFVSYKNSRVVIEGVNLIKKTVRPTQENTAGGFVEREGSIHISNVMVVHNGLATKVGWKILDDGSKVRISKKNNEEIKV
jgi:large subunit ribosomal protein L24